MSSEVAFPAVAKRQQVVVRLDDDEREWLEREALRLTNEIGLDASMSSVIRMLIRRAMAASEDEPGR